MQTANHPDVPLPPGAEFGDEWQPDHPQAYRIIQTPDRHIEGHDKLTLWGIAVQRADGTIDVNEEPPTVSIQVSWEDGLTTAQARELAALILATANELDGWVAG
jgi:hypothetical protein